MKTILNLKNYLMLTALILVQMFAQAQVANWNFNGVLSGTGSANTFVTDASLGSSIDLGTSGYNGGTLYYGGDGWPTGSLDPNAYLEFSVAPTAATMTLTYIALNMRRSTTGTAAGSGPTSWSLRSSIDGYTADISAGTLTLVTTPTVTITLSASFVNLPSKTTFRLYGYNAVVTAGGLNRFVYDNISIAGSTVLPITLDAFKAIKTNNDVQLSWQLAGEGNTSALNVERSANGSDFSVIGQVSLNQSSSNPAYSYTDHLGNTGNGDLYYRIQMISADGFTSYSPVQKISLAAAGNFAIDAAYGRPGSAVQFTVITSKADQYYFYLYTINGNKIAAKTISLGEGSQALSLDGMQTKSGIYILVAQHDGQQVSRKVAIR